MQAKYQSRPQNITEFIDILNLNKEDREDNEGCEDIKESKESRIIIQTSLNSPIIHKYVDLGLRVKWAAYNIGSNKPYENGTYFGLRKTFPMCNNDSLELIKFENGLITIATNSDKDIASLLWGGNWRLPTEYDFYELIEKCTWVWTKMLGHNGYKIIGTNGNSIFLPAAGYHDGDNCQKCGYYRTSNMEMNNHKLHEGTLRFDEHNFSVKHLLYPFNQEQYWTDLYPVRAVID